MSLAPLILIDPEERQSIPYVDLPPSDYPLHLELGPGREDSYWWKVIAASAAGHLLLLLIAIRLPSFVIQSAPQRRMVEHKIPLYLPRDLTQKAKNQHEVTKQIDLDSLLALQTRQASQSSPDFSRKQFEMPKNEANPRAAKTPVTILPEAPTVTVSQANTPPLPGAPNGLPTPPPPPKPSTGPFENVGSEAPPNPHPTLAPPKPTVQAVVDGLKQSGNGKNLTITDDSPSQGAPPTPGTIGQPGAQHAGVELKTDPQGADMKPYLAQILRIVRGNWRRVIPAAVSQGSLRGRTVMEFIINRDGSLAKIVTAESSGSDPLDRAAQVGMVMSNPLPPLPADFKGQQVRLAFTFNYNMTTP